jgi:hypothetical protein
LILLCRRCPGPGRPAMSTQQPCPRCSKRLPSNARFCRRCGLGLAARTVGTASARPVPLPSRNAVRSDGVPSRRRAARPMPTVRYPKGRLRGWVFCLICYAMIGVASLIKSLAPRSPNPPPIVTLPRVRYGSPALPFVTAPIPTLPRAPFPQQGYLPPIETYPGPSVSPIEINPPSPRRVDRDWDERPGEASRPYHDFRDPGSR